MVTDTPPSKHSVNKKKRAPVHESLSQAELFNLYNMLNGVKLDLLWGRNSEMQPEEVEQQHQQEAAKLEQQQSIESKGHVRRPSTASVASSNSTNTLSDSDSEISNENDSGIESECNNHSEIDRSTELAKQYRQHLLGLYRCLEQMTDAANYLTARYQSDIGPV